MLTKEEMPACPVATTVQLIGSKWKLLILRNLLARPWRFNELRKEVPPRVEYSLTPLGESMKPILDAMEKWGTEYKKRLCTDADNE